MVFDQTMEYVKYKQTNNNNNNLNKFVYLMELKHWNAIKAKRFQRLVLLSIVNDILSILAISSSKLEI